MANASPWPNAINTRRAETTAVTRLQIMPHSSLCMARCNWDHFTIKTLGNCCDIEICKVQKWHKQMHRIMKMSSDGSIFRITGPLCGEFTSHRWIPLTKASNTELWCFLWCTDLAKSSWTFFSGAYFTILCCTETYHNFTTYFTTTLVLMFWISQAYAIASCISAYFCDVAYALLKIKFGHDANRISMTSHRDRC